MSELTKKHFGLQWVDKYGAFAYEHQRLDDDSKVELSPAGRDDLRAWWTRDELEARGFKNPLR